MAEDTLIAWTDHTFNPWMGCTRVSEGCRNCYAETLTKNRMGLQLWGPTAERQVTKTPWKNVLEWERTATRGIPGNYGHAFTGRPLPTAAASDYYDPYAPPSTLFTPHLVFTGSLMDWAEDRPDLVEPRARMWDLIRRCTHLWFQMLTKRPENIPKFLPADWGAGYENVWLGTTVEDNRVKHRVDELRRANARAHFISYEPAIGPADEVNLDDIEWVICGGESGSGYRELDMQWARHMRDRCVERGIAFFMKQGSAYRTEMNPFLVERDGSKWAWKQYPGKLDPPMRIAA